MDISSGDLFSYYARLATALMDRSHYMTAVLYQGHRVTWWEAAPTPPDDMTYECEANLGSPASVDCSQL